MSDKGIGSDLDKDDLPVNEEEIATHQEAIPLPYLAGTRRIGVRWMAPALDMVTQQTSDEPGKK